MIYMLPVSCINKARKRRITTQRAENNGKHSLKHIVSHSSWHSDMIVILKCPLGWGESIIFHDNDSRQMLLFSGSDESGPDTGLRLILRTFIAHYSTPQIGGMLLALSVSWGPDCWCPDCLKYKEDKAMLQEVYCCGLFILSSNISFLIFL